MFPFIITIVIFAFFGISVHSFRIVGGVHFFLMGMDMLQARLGKVKVSSSEVKSYIDDISITPLAIPMICGPGALTNAIVMMEDADSFEKKVVLIITVLLVMLLNYLILYSSSRIIKNIRSNWHQCNDEINGVDCYGYCCRILFCRIKANSTRYF